MNVIELLAKAAQQNHGRQLDAPAVKEVLMTLQIQQKQLLGSQGRLDALTRVAGVLLERLGGTANITPDELDAFADGPGFTIEWDEETDVIHVNIAMDEVDVPEVPVDADAAASSEGGLAPVPEDGGDAEPEEASSDEADEGTE